jgi:hypothetical protein
VSSPKLERRKYSSNHYPNFKHNGQECEVVSWMESDNGKKTIDEHGGAWVRFAGDSAIFLVPRQALQ